MKVGDPGFVGIGQDGRFLHYCHCGKWGGWGFGVNRPAGELGQWYCDAHRPNKEKARDEGGTEGQRLREMREAAARRAEQNRRLTKGKAKVKAIGQVVSIKAVKRHGTSREG